MTTGRRTAKRCCRTQPALHNYRGTCEGPYRPSKRKKIDGVALFADIYTGVATTAAGDIIPTTPAEWEGHWRYVAKGKAAGDSGVTTDMPRLAPECLAEIVP